MKTPNTITTLAGRFDRLSLRERVLTMAAILAVLIALFDSLVLQRLDMRKKQLALQLSGIVSAIDGGGATDDGSNPGVTLQRTTALAASLSEATARLDSQSAGLIPPQRMTRVIHDVLSRQQGVTLVSLRSLAPYAVIDGAPSQDDAQHAGADVSADQAASASAVNGAAEGPYFHSVQLVLQGRYLDVLAYLEALEGLSWHFYWQSIALDATHYPTTRVTVILGTVSMSRDWIDL
jgi:MSHA biogenesis protein MshJ